MKRIGRFFAVMVLAGLLGAGLKAQSTTKDDLPFEKSVLPLFQAKCLQCHGDKKQKAGLDLRTRAAVVHGGESGPGLKPGSLAESILWEKVNSDQMPPGKDKLSAAEKETLRRWIETGAPTEARAAVAAVTNFDLQVSDEDRQFWAFRPPLRPAIPAVKMLDRVGNPIDAFILAALEAKGLTMSPEADRLTLLRRVTFDLTGLPPSPQDIETFVADTSPQAYEKLVDKLLAGASYGERWARHWLDVAGYADSEGVLSADYVRAAAWRYRDYVIRALNQDKPFDRFLLEQIAGDELVDYWTVYQTHKELPAEVVEALTATGYLRCAGDTSRPDHLNTKKGFGYFYQTLDDTLKIVASSTMGLTVQCAKCHSHKYDPIPQTDYYRLQAILMSGYRPSQWVPQAQRKLLEATAHQENEARQHNAPIEAAVLRLKKQQDELQQEFAAKLFEQDLAKLPAVIRDDVRVALTMPAAKRSVIQAYLADKFQAELKATGPVLLKKLEEDAEYKTKHKELAKAIEQQESQRRTFPEIRAFYDVPGEAKTHLLRRGDVFQPGPEVPPGVLAVLTPAKNFSLPVFAKEAKTSGRRLAFARWLTRPEHPLTARVLVNRLWLHHFGQGLVATPDNFGRTGSPPSHPELLDWLATEFVSPSEAGTKAWSQKALHKLIVTSSTYRQISQHQPALHAKAKRVDPGNRLLWRQRLRRLEAEALRDAVLVVAGNLNPEMFGTPVAMVGSASGEVTTPANASGKRRSIYLQVRRYQPLTFLQVFDQPVIETNCIHRETSTVASQALTLLNSDFMQLQAETLAARVFNEQPSDPCSRAVLLAFGRAPGEAEKNSLRRFLEAQSEQHARELSSNQVEARRRALADLCHMLLSANEFAYVD